MDEELTTEEIRERDKKKIIGEVRAMGGCAHWVEISEAVGMERRQCYPLIGELIREGRLKRLDLSPNEVPPELRPKLPHYWARGIMYHSQKTKKYIPFTQYKWCALPPEAAEELEGLNAYETEI